MADERPACCGEALCRDVERDRDAWQARAERLAADQAMAQDDLAAIQRELGLGDHARPRLPHEVVHAAVLPAIRRLRPEPTGEYLRVGSQVGRTIYRCTPDDPKGHLVGVMDTREWAAEVVAAVNQARYGRGEEAPDADT